MYYLGITHYDLGQLGITALGHQGLVLFEREKNGEIKNRENYGKIEDKSTKSNNL